MTHSPSGTGPRRTGRSVALASILAGLLAAGGERVPALGATGPVQNPGNGHWYELVATSNLVGWDQARAAAEARGGSLACITSAAENQWIMNTLGPLPNGAWLGASDVANEGTWVWVSGEAWSWSNWDPSVPEPNNLGGVEDYLVLKTSGYWNDLSTPNARGYVIEWDADPSGGTALRPPEAPTNLSALYTPATGVILSWDDRSSTETGFQVERSVAAYGFAVRGVTAADVTSWIDTGLPPGATLTYRVAAANAAGVSAYSNEVSVTTSSSEPPPPPPRAPGNLVAYPAGARAVLVRWTDASDDEAAFALERAEGGEPFRGTATVPVNVTEQPDDSVRPGWPYSWRVRALSPQGPSGWSNVARATTDATLTVELVSGSLADSRKPLGDKVKVTVKYGAVSAGPDATFDPVADGLDLQVGPIDSPVGLHVPPGDPAWRTKRQRSTWKSPRESPLRATVVVDAARGTLRVTVTRSNFVASSETPTVRVLLASGDDGGSQVTPWDERRPGAWRYRP